MAADERIYRNRDWTSSRVLQIFRARSATTDLAHFYFFASVNASRIFVGGQSLSSATNRNPSSRVRYLLRSPSVHVICTRYKSDGSSPIARTCFARPL